MSTTNERDVEEARHLLREGELLRERGRMSTAKKTAIKDLFAQFGRLTGAHGLEVEEYEGWNELSVKVGRKTGKLIYLDEGGVRIVTPDNLEHRVELDYDKANNELLGVETETLRVPVPGELPRRRSGLVALVDALLRAFA